MLRRAPHLLLHPALHRHLPHLHLDGRQAGPGEEPLHMHVDNLITLCLVLRVPFMFFNNSLR